MEIKELIDLLPKDYEKECYEKRRSGENER